MQAYKKIVLVFLVLIAIWGAVFLLKKEYSLPQGVTYVMKNLNGTTSTGTVSTASSETVAYLRKVSGTVEINSIPAQANATLGGKDVIVSKNASEAEIVFSDNSVVRLAANSTLTLASSTDSQSVSLESGELWARILKPLGDSSFFTIKTSNLSAGVRGTAVTMKKTATGSAFKVIDSYSGSGATSPVKLTYIKEKQEVTEELKNEEWVAVSETGAMIKEKVNVAEILKKEPFVRESIKKDIVYMDELRKKLEVQTATGAVATGAIEKIKGEIVVSLPKPNEVSAFFSSEIIKTTAVEVVTVIPPSGTPTEDQVQKLLEMVKGDRELEQKKEDLERKKETSFTGTTEDERKKYQQEINALDEAVRSFDEKWKEQYEANLKDLGIEATSSGTIAPPPAPKPIAPIAPKPLPPKPPTEPIAVPPPVEEKEDVIETDPIVEPAPKPIVSGSATPQ